MFCFVLFLFESTGETGKIVHVSHKNYHICEHVSFYVNDRNTWKNKLVWNKLCFHRTQYCEFNWYM